MKSPVRPACAARRLIVSATARSLNRLVASPDALEVKPWAAVREAGGGALAVGGDQVGGVALIKAIAQVPRTLRTRLRGTDRGW